MTLIKLLTQFFLQKKTLKMCFFCRCRRMLARIS